MKKLLLIAAILFSGILPAFADDFPEPMSPPRLVNDFAGMLTAAENAALEQRLDSFDRASSVQIAIVSVPDLGGYDASQYATRLFEKWGIGHDGKDNGVLILLKPKTADSYGEAFICTGYGVEGVVTDAAARRIVADEMLPEFSAGNTYRGLDKAVSVLFKLLDGEFTADEYAEGSEDDLLVDIIVLVLIVLFVVYLSRRGGRGGSGTPPIIFFGGGGFGGGSGGGGGFGGFGGGNTGGGGAGGRW